MVAQTGCTSICTLKAALSKIRGKMRCMTLIMQVGLHLATEFWLQNSLHHDSDMFTSKEQYRTYGWQSSDADPARCLHLLQQCQY